ncbi:MAG: endolytic transglycosylase MltG, partial [Gammaproteobacteria bacterium]|nr:endolytic transglycosylase MltG [Gammaproteobacteria bacterium]
DLVILKRAFDLMKNKLATAWEKRALDLPYQNAYEALIAASLIEKEAYLNTERPIIGGVLINRLRKNMLLQFDPTVIYGLGTRYNGKIHKQDLLENTAYNTYVHRGLPPTPIAMPGLASLQAATHPDTNDYIYFVAKGDGSHQFSKTLSEHNAAVKKANKHDQR